MDAISFVLGVRTRHLRSERLIELVHRKEGESSEAVARRPASVELVYVLGDGAGKDAAAEVVFRRQVNPPGAATFQVDGQSVSQAEYMTHLEGINILSKARNCLIFQGDVEAAAHRGGKDLTVFFEQVSGSVAFREEYEQIAAEKNQKEDAARYLYTKKRNAINERKRLQQQKEEADRYRSLELEHQKLQVEFYLFRLYGLTQQDVDAEKERRRIESERQELEVKTVGQQRALEEAERERAKAHLATIQADRGVTAARKELEQRTPESVDVRSRIQVYRQRLEDSVAHTRKEERRCQQLESQVAGLRSEEEKLNVQLERAAAQSKTELSFTDEQRKRFEQAQQAAERMTATSGQQLRELEAQIRQSTAERFHVEREMRDVHLRHQQLTQRVEDAAVAAEEAQAAWERDAKISKEHEIRRERLEHAGAQFQEEKQRLHQERQGILKGIQDITATERQIQYEQRLARVSSELMQLVPGVHGRVLELCSPAHASMNIAVNVALGGYLDAVVADTADASRRCVQHLKDRMLDPLTFLPLDNLRIAPPDHRLQDAVRSHASLRMALNCIRFEDHLRRAFEFLLGDVVFASSMEDGRRFVFSELRAKGMSCRVVTLSGETISRDGNLSVSSEAAQAGATRFDFQTLEAKKSRLEAIDSRLYEIHSLETSEGTIESAMQEASQTSVARAQESEHHAARCREEVETKEAELQRTAEILSVIQPKARQLLVEEGRLREEQRKLEEAIGNAVSSHFAQLSADMGVDDIRKRERECRRVREEAQLHMNELTQQLGSVQAEMKMVMQSLDERTRQGAAQAEQNLQRELADLEQRREHLEQQLHAAETELARRETVTKERSETERGFELAVTKCRQGLRESQRLVNDIERQLAAVGAELQSLRQARVHILRRVVLEDVPVPLVKNGREILQELAAAATEAQQAQLSAINIEVDFSPLPDDKKAVPPGPASVLIEEEYSSELRRLGAELERLKPNLKAIKQFAGASEQAEGALQDAATARLDIEDVERRFEAVRKARRERFMDCFQKVAPEINKVYQKLTANSAETILDGGSAYLDLEDLEEPYNGAVRFTAMPPSKRFSDMSLLSGGERSLAALSLLFALQAYQKPPFIVLDEVDAHLDVNNVQTLARYIESSDCQTVVISLKHKFFSHGQGLIGVSMNRLAKASVVLTFDLTRFRRSGAGDTNPAPIHDDDPDSRRVPLQGATSPMPLPPSDDRPGASQTPHTAPIPESVGAGHSSPNPRDQDEDVDMGVIPQEEDVSMEPG